MLYRGMDRAQLDAAYNNSGAVPERGAIVADWASHSARVRREYAGRLDLAYGETPRERLDLFPRRACFRSGSISRSSNTRWRQRLGSTASFLRCVAPCGGWPNISPNLAPIPTGYTSPDIRPAAT